MLPDEFENREEERAKFNELRDKPDPGKKGPVTGKGEFPPAEVEGASGLDWSRAETDRLTDKPDPGKKGPATDVGVNTIPVDPKDGTGY